MECKRVTELLSEYIDGRLSVEDSAAIAAHLEGCAACRRAEAELRRTVALVCGLETKAAPEGFADAVAARLERSMLLDGRPAAEAPEAPSARMAADWGRAGGSGGAPRGRVHQVRLAGADADGGNEFRTGGGAGAVHRRPRRWAGAGRGV